MSWFASVAPATGRAADRSRVRTRSPGRRGPRTRSPDPVDVARRSLVLGAADAPRCLVFVPGFVVPAHAYATLLEPIAARWGRVVVLAPEASTIALLSGRHTAAQQAEQIGRLARDLRRDGTDVTLGGHSRGGFVAWLAARSVAPDVEPAGLVLIDPVSGDGGPRKAPEPLPVLDLACPSLVIGCGIGGRCAPTDRNHDVFAAARPGGRHTVVADCAHADVLDGWSARLGGLLCGHGRDRPRARAAVTRVMLDFLV